MSFRLKVLIPILVVMVAVSVLLTGWLTDASLSWARQEQDRFSREAEQQRKRVQLELETFAERFIRSWSLNNALAKPEALTTLTEDLERFHEGGMIRSAVVYDRGGVVRRRVPLDAGGGNEAEGRDREFFDRVIAGGEVEFDGRKVWVPFRNVEAPQRATITGRLPPATAVGSPPVVTGSWEPRAPRLLTLQFQHFKNEHPDPFRPSVMMSTEWDEAHVIFNGPTNVVALDGAGLSAHEWLSRTFEPPEGVVWADVESWQWNRDDGADVLRLRFATPLSTEHVQPGDELTLNTALVPEAARITDPTGRRPLQPGAVLAQGAIGRSAFSQPELRGVRLHDPLFRPGLQAGDRAIFEFSRPTNQPALESLADGDLTRALTMLFPVRNAETGEAHRWPTVAEALWIEDGSYLEVSFAADGEGASSAAMVSAGDVIERMEPGVIFAAGDPSLPACASWPGTVVTGGFHRAGSSAPQMWEARVCDFDGGPGLDEGDRCLVRFDRPTNALDLNANPTSELDANLNAILRLPEGRRWRGVSSARWASWDTLVLAWGAGVREGPRPGDTITVAGVDAPPISRVIRMEMTVTPPPFSRESLQAASQEAAQEQIGRINTAIWLVMGAGGAVLVVVVFLLLSGLVLQPLGGLMRASTRIAAGDFSKVVPAVERHDEVGQLINAFSSMMSEVLTFRADMEGKVARAAKTIEETQRRLVTAQRLAGMGTLASGIAHEINNPLGGMLNAVRRLLRNARERGAPEKDVLYLELIEDGLIRIQRTVTKILQFSPRRQSEPPKSDVSDLAEAIERALALKEHDLEKHGIEVVRDYAPRLSAVPADATELQQVILNLLINAIDAIRASQRPGRITVRTREQQGQVALAIEDSGCGMSEAQLAQAFDMFYTTKEQGQGTGLGLFIVHHIVTTLGGEVRVQSREGEGTTFTVLLPVASGAGAAVGHKPR